MNRVAIVLALSVITAQASAEDTGRPGTVTLPRGEYDRLLDRAVTASPVPPAPPLSAVLSRAELRLRVEAGLVRGSFELHGEVLRAGPTRVPIIGGGTVLQVSQDGRALPLLHEAGGVHALVTGPGAFVLAVDWATEVVTDPRGAAFVLPVPAAGSVRAVVEVPEARGDIQVQPGVVVARTAAAGKTRIEAALDGGRPARFWWSSRQGPTAPREARFLSEMKTLVTVGEGQLQMAALLEVTVLQGALDRLSLTLPPGFDVTSVSGETLESFEHPVGRLNLSLREPARPRHQFLVGLERATADGSFTLELPLPSALGAQRETGEVAVEGLGTLELAAAEKGTLRRMDVSEAKAALLALAREPLLAAFRYHGTTGGAPILGLDVKRFADAAVLAAVAERAVVTTLVTREGRALTEVTLTVRNQARPFVKISLPQDVSVLSAEVAGQSVKPVQGADGTRLPLLRPGFRPQGPYAVSFVFLRAGAPFGKKGDAEIVLPRLDLPVSLVSWELFLPEGYRVKKMGGDVLPGEALVWEAGAVGGGAGGGPGEVGGLVTDSSGGTVPGATVTLVGPGGMVRNAMTAGDGSFVFAGVSPGRYRISAELSGFKKREHTLSFSGRMRAPASLVLEAGTITETVSVEAEAPLVDVRTSSREQALKMEPGGGRRNREDQAQVAPSANVLNLQRRVAGVLPVRIDVPRVGESHHVFRPLVLDEETTVRFSYKAR
jgi:hypothetical protein